MTYLTLLILLLRLIIVYLVFTIHSNWAPQQGVGSQSSVRRTQFADKVHCAVVAAEGRVQADQELHVQACHLALQDVGNGLPLVLIRLPLTACDAGAPSEQRSGVVTLDSGPLFYWECF